MLERKELEDVLTGIQTTLNKRSLTYTEDYIQFPVFTPNLLALGLTPIISNAVPTDIENKDLQKRRKVH